MYFISRYSEYDKLGPKVCKEIIKKIIKKIYLEHLEEKLLLKI